MNQSINQSINRIDFPIDSSVHFLLSSRAAVATSLP